MSLLQWFSRKSAPEPAPPPEEDSALGYSGVSPGTFAASTRGGHAKVSLSEPGSATSQRRSERQERREQLYTTIRDTMTHAGVLSSSYKFKVLSLDSHGRQYLVMFDLLHQYPGDMLHLAGIELALVQQAKSRHDILVTAVYWRAIEPVVPATAPPPQPAAIPAPPSAPSATTTNSPLSDELAAFKQAFATVAAPTGLSASGEIIKDDSDDPPKQRKRVSNPDFEATRLDEQIAPSLSGTQFGDLR